MLDVVINGKAVVVAGLAAAIIGAVWYSKIFLGSVWQKAVRLKDKDMKKGSTKSMIGGIVLNLLAAYVLAHFVAYAQATTWWDGATTGFWVWLGFVFTVLLTNTIFAQRGKKLFLINAGYQLVALLVMGAILGAWA